MKWVHTLLSPDGAMFIQQSLKGTNLYENLLEQELQDGGRDWGWGPSVGTAIGCAAIGVLAVVLASGVLWRKRPDPQDDKSCCAGGN